MGLLLFLLLVVLLVLLLLSPCVLRFIAPPTPTLWSTVLAWYLQL